MALKELTPEQRFLIKARRALDDFEKAYKEMAAEILKHEKVDRPVEMKLYFPGKGKYEVIK